MGETPLLRLGVLLLLILAGLGIVTELVMRQLQPSHPGPEVTAQAVATRKHHHRADSAAATSARADTAPPCRVLASGIALPRSLHESSGIAQSRRDPALLWTHDDSGRPVVYAVDSTGAEKARVTVTGATNVNWEDIAVAACPGGDCLYVGDIGDNQARRANVTVYRVPEPGAAVSVSAPAQAFSATYPDGAQDAEAMFVLPDGAIYIATKGETGPAGLYRFPQPLRAGATVMLEKVAGISDVAYRRHERITGGSASRDGRWIALRTLKSVSFYRTQGGAVRALANPVVMDLSPLNEAQGEGVGFGEHGVVFLTSEGGSSKKNHATLARLACTLPS
ncbi:MAG TPA: hypothetical protein VFJ82_06885 [Longimicrobium sp.]|nr:hypothetical protein [Longimicrobium sp.]